MYTIQNIRFTSESAAAQETHKNKSMHVCMYMHMHIYTPRSIINLTKIDCCTGNRPNQMHIHTYIYTTQIIKLTSELAATHRYQAEKIDVSMCALLSMCVHGHTYIHVHGHTSMYVHGHTYIHVNGHTCMYVHGYICSFVCINEMMYMMCVCVW